MWVFDSSKHLSSSFNMNLFISDSSIKYPIYTEILDKDLRNFAEGKLKDYLFLIILGTSHKHLFEGINALEKSFLSIDIIFKFFYIQRMIFYKRS